jgi:hypothetical protein
MSAHGPQALSADPARRAPARQPHRDRSHVPVLGCRWGGHKLAPDPPRSPGALRSRPSDHRSHGRAAGGAHQPRRSGLVVGRDAERSGEGRRSRSRVLRDADRHSARPCRSQELEPAALGRRGADPDHGGRMAGLCTFSSAPQGGRRAAGSPEPGRSDGVDAPAALVCQSEGVAAHSRRRP